MGPGALPPVPPPVTEYELMLARCRLSNAAVRRFVEQVPDLDALGELTTKEIDSCTKSMRRPGGMVQTVTGYWITDPGVRIDAGSSTLLQTCGFAKRQMYLASRPLDPIELTTDLIYAWKCDLLTNLNYNEDTTLPDATLFFSDWPKGFETLDTFISKQRSDTERISLGYLIRTSPAVTPHADDPRANYSNLEIEQNARCPHTRTLATGDVVVAEYYKEDNKKLWLLIHDIFRETHAYPFIKEFSRATDGRGAYLALFQHYLGPNNKNNIAAAAERDLMKLSYTGETKRYNFEKYVGGHKKCHNIFDGLVRYGYSSMDKGTKVRHFVNGINHPTLNAIKATVWHDQTLANDFEAVCAMFKTVIQQSNMAATAGVNTTIATAEVKKTSGSRKSVSWKTTTPTPSKNVDVALRFYSPEEYAKFSNEEKLILKRKREAAGMTGQSNGGGGGKPKAKKIAAVDSKVDKKSSSNRTHSALRRDAGASDTDDDSD